MGVRTDDVLTTHPGPYPAMFRWGPLALLLLASGLAAVSAVPLMTRGEMCAAAVLASVAFVSHVGWARIGPGGPQHSVTGQTYFWVRWAVAFTLSWLNPFFCVYALAGYFDSDRWLPGRRYYVGLAATAVVMAGAQAGGMPPDELVQWAVFAALLLLNCGLALTFARIAARDTQLLSARAVAIAELERTNARLEQALAENARLQAQLLVQAREAGVDDERRRLAAEIHDTLAQGLIGIITQLQAATDSADPAAARAHVDRAADLARRSLGDARRSVQNLAPKALEHDALPDALRATVGEWASATGVRAEFTVTGTVAPLHDEVEATLLRIAQEALANVARHADAARVGVTLSYMGDEVTLDVRDDGRGFDAAAPVSPPRPDGSRRFGLAGMRARAERIAGAVDVESEPGRGTAVSARVPLVGHG